MRKWRVRRPGRPGIPHQTREGGLGRGRFKEGRTDTSPALPGLSIWGSGSGGGVAVSSTTLFFFPPSGSTDSSRRSSVFPPTSPPCVCEAGEPGSPRAATCAGVRPRAPRGPGPRPHPLSGRAACGSVHGAVQSEGSNAAETRGRAGEGLQAARVSMATVSGRPEHPGAVSGAPGFPPPSALVRGDRWSWAATAVRARPERPSASLQPRVSSARTPVCTPGKRAQRVCSFTARFRYSQAEEVDHLFHRRLPSPYG